MSRVGVSAGTVASDHYLVKDIRLLLFPAKGSHLCLAISTMISILPLLRILEFFNFNKLLKDFYVSGLCV